ncbi:transaldolase [Candidatus Spongiisocius sp.]|uniref:transaldolase n=1 Tax=Candidatus Spongiisocius sp. TaxID=3101273 RepID=UPI003B5BF1CB
MFGERGSRLRALGALGQSVWLDSISREMLRSGELERYVEAGITGITSNPTIFAKAMLSGDSYDAQIDELVSHDADVDEIYTAVVTRDIRRACDVMAPTHRRSGGLDGFVSVEVSPELAHEAEATVAEARDWVKRVDRPNLLIKIPATLAGLTAIEAATAEGISVNVTLIFSLGRYLAVIDAYMSGLERFREAGGNPASVNSVASFFVSRFDTEVDKRLGRIGTPEAAALEGRTAVANARVAYLEFLRAFSSDRWYRLRRNGANVQKPLWASTSTKNPAYSDTLYIDTLVAPETVNTLPESAIAAYQDHGPDTPEVLGINQLADGVLVLEDLEAVGVDYEAVTAKLEQDGVSSFADSFREMVGDIQRKRAMALRSGATGR